MAASTVNAKLRVLLLLTSVWAINSQAQEIPPPAYQLAAQQAGIPSTVLFAVALQESGLQRNDRIIPWPWSLNIAGQSHRYTTQSQACAGLQKALRDVPLKRIDAGLAQINLGYQKHRYSQPCELLDPSTNLQIAAAILREQYRPGEDWLLAMGRYHRPAGGEPAARYRRSVSRHLNRVQGSSATPRTMQSEVSP